MKLNTDETPMTTNISGSESFTIEASEKAFAILSGGIYSNTKRAVIRELSCNAYDSHKYAGHPERPFDIVLPTKLTPYFEIRDFGTGMSDDDVRHLYTTYFSSTKTGSNDFIGALGLGSKSPFSYADSFVIISYFDGKANSYLAFKDGKGRPQITNTGSIDSTEENGIRIKVPVQENDFNSFKDEAIFVFKTFEVKPNFVGVDPDCEIKKSISIEGVGFCSSDWGRSFYAIQGNVRYRIDNSKIPNEISNGVSGDTFLYFNIGDLGVAASREELAYDEGTTEEAITKKVNEFREGVIKNLADSISKEKTRYGAGRTYIDFMDNSSFYESFLSDDTPTWNGVDIRSYSRSGRTVKSKTRCFYDASDLHGAETIKLKMRHNTTFCCRDRLAIVIDIKTNFRRRIREYCEANEIPINRVLVIKDRIASAKAWSKVLDGMPVKLVSEMPEIKKEYRRSTPVKRSVPVYDCYMNESSVAIDDVKCYVEMNRWEVVSRHSHHNLASYATLHNITYYMIKTANLKSFQTPQLI